ncbi:MAG: ABC transporter ATP-binding protein [Planctomycetes bacterium]|nr:ABC transporter ATP-binding protein [Planctomycetota bacterium]
METRALRRTLGSGENALEILHGLDVVIQPGEFCSIMGPSGSGKSTLMYLLGALDRPTGGQVLIDGIDTKALSEAALADVRNRKIGFVFQFHYLMPEFTAEENVALPMRKLGLARRPALERARELLGLLGLAGKEGRLPGRLSGGEQQRVAIARSLANRPLVVLGDEPTGNLDTKNGELVFALFERLVREQGQTIVVVTHDPRLAARTDRVVRLQDGKVVDDGPARAVLARAGERS